MSINLSLKITSTSPNNGVFKKEKFKIDINKNGVFINGKDCHFEFEKVAKNFCQTKAIKAEDGYTCHFYNDDVCEKIGKMSFKERLEKSKTNEIADIVLSSPSPISQLVISQKIKKKKKLSEKFIHKSPPKEALKFENFNFKIAVINELMYNQGLIEKFDVFEFCDELGIDPYASFGAISRVKRWFKELEIDATLAENLSELYLDAGNEIYAQIAPDWDTEDELFDIKSIEISELRQFKNLKKISINSLAISKKARKICSELGILIEE